MGFFLANIEVIGYSIGGLLLASIILLWRHNLIEYGKDIKEAESSEAHLQATKNNEKLANAVINHKRGTGIASLKRLHDKSGNR